MSAATHVRVLGPNEEVNETIRYVQYTVNQGVNNVPTLQCSLACIPLALHRASERFLYRA